MVLAGLVVVASVVVTVGLLTRRGKPGNSAPTPPGPAYEQVKTDPTAYAGSGSCRKCHKEASDQWQTSHHALAERRFEPGRDRAAFDPPQSFKHGTQNSDVRVAPNGRCEIVTMSRTGDRSIFSPERVLGEDPLRQFLVTAPGGRYQVTEVAYDPRSNQWFNVYGEEDRQPGEWGHWTGRGMNWNMMCAFCHNTGLQKNYEAATDSYGTSLVEMGVGCEACHGPMADHVKWQQPRPQPAMGDPTLRRFSKTQMRDTCAACHARRAELTGTMRVGEAFFNHYALTIPDETDLYYADGQVRDEDYEYAAFLGSRMNFSKVWCGDCHSPHTAKIRLPHDRLCMTCHAGPIAPAPKIDAATHSFHQRGTAGDHCVDCHMPMTVYMGRHWRRDHGFTIPDPLLTKEHHIPNACNRCHQDKTTDWAIAAVNKWYGPRMERPTRTRTRIVAKARTAQTEAVPGLLKMAREETIPYWRAVATLLLRHWADDTNVVSLLLQQTSDPDALVRTVAVRALEPLAAHYHPAALPAAQRLLSDPVRVVRVDAAWTLRRTLETNTVAAQDLFRYLDWNSDQPQGLMQRAVWNMDRGDNPAALAQLERAVTWDPYSPPLFSALAVSLSVEGRHGEALAAMEKASKLAPRDAEYRFRLALALNELNRLKEAVAALEETVKLDPAFVRAWYNLGLAYSSQGESDRALQALGRAESLEPASPQIPFARATILSRQGRIAEARAAVQRALALSPTFPEALALLRQLQ
jgi:tetratricopeptide (TPR) repeat protein